MLKRRHGTRCWYCTMATLSWYFFPFFDKCYFVLIIFPDSANQLVWLISLISIKTSITLMGISHLTSFFQVQVKQAVSGTFFTFPNKKSHLGYGCLYEDGTWFIALWLLCVQCIWSMHMFSCYFCYLFHGHILVITRVHEPALYEISLLFTGFDLYKGIY